MLIWVLLLSIGALGLCVVSGFCAGAELVTRGITPLSKFLIIFTYVCLAVFICACIAGAVLRYLEAAG